MPSKERLYCPDCGTRTLEVVECTEPDTAGEYKDVCICRDCDNLVYVVRGLPPTVVAVDT